MDKCWFEKLEKAREPTDIKWIKLYYII